MFRKSMGSGDNGKPHKRSRTWERAFARKLYGLTHDVRPFLRLLLNRGGNVGASCSSVVTDRGYSREVIFPVL